MTMEPTSDRGESGRDSAGARTMDREELFSGAQGDEYAARWEQIQAEFVDDPRSTVACADVLVRDVIDELTRTFKSERTSLEQQWGDDAEADTEDLRVALQRYRSLFQRLLTR